MTKLQELAKNYVNSNIAIDNPEEEQQFIDTYIAGMRKFNQLLLQDKDLSVFIQLKIDKMFSDLDQEIE